MTRTQKRTFGPQLSLLNFGVLFITDPAELQRGIWPIEVRRVIGSQLRIAAVQLDINASAALDA